MARPQIVAAAMALATACSSVGLPRGMPDRGDQRPAGIVLSVAPAARTLTLLDAGRTLEIPVARKADIRRGQSSLALGDLRRGDHVVIVSMNEAKQPRATRIAVSGPALRPPTAPPDPEESTP